MRKKRTAMASSAQLQMLADESARRAGPPSERPLSAEPVAESEPAFEAVKEQRDYDRPPFGAWLVNQHQHNRDWIAGLAKVAKADHRFPKAGSADQVREYLAKQGADGDAFEALDDAEMDWLSL